MKKSYVQSSLNVKTRHTHAKICHSHFTWVQDGTEAESIASHSNLRQDLRLQLDEVQELEVLQQTLEAV